METVWYLETLPGRFAPVAMPLAAVTPQVSARRQTVRDLNGRQAVYVLGYEERLKAGPCYVSQGDALYHHLRRILEKGLILDALKTALVQVEPDGRAQRREAYLEITGADEGRIAFCLHFTGRKQSGSFDPDRRRFSPR